MKASLDRIVVINDLSHPMGGASALAVGSARSFAERGYRVALLAGDAPDPALAEAGIAATGLGQARLLRRGGAFLDGLWNRTAARMIRRWIAEHDTPRTVYHLHGWSQILSPSVFAALAPVRQRLVISAHDFFLACPNGAFTQFRTGELCPHTALSRACLAEACDRRGQAHKLWRVARFALQRFAWQPQSSPPVLAIHAAMRPMLARAGIPAEAIHPLPNPVVPYSRTRIAAERNDTLLFVGRIEATKGADLALAAARRASVPIILVGDGADRARLAADYPEAHFAGRLAPGAIGALAASARLLVMPSRYPEPYGLVAMEAALAGLPVVLPPTALLAPDLVAAGAAAMVYPQDIVAHAAVLAALAKDDERVEAMSRAGFTATRHLALSPEEWIDRLLEHYAGRLEPDQASAALAGAVDPRVGLATHYHADYVVPVWRSGLVKLAQVGLHLFYRWPGDWGSPAVLRPASGGEEPRIAAMAALSPAHGRAESTLAANAGAATGTAAQLAYLPVDEAEGPPRSTTPAAATPSGQSAGARIVLTLDPAAFPGTYAMRALAACAERDRCAVVGNLTGSAPGQGPGFVYVRDRRTGAEGAWWDCTALPRANPARCLPKGTALARLLAEWG